MIEIFVGTQKEAIKGFLKKQRQNIAGQDSAGSFTNINRTY